jgi:hypothetical protein
MYGSAFTFVAQNDRKLIGTNTDNLYKEGLDDSSLLFPWKPG